MALSECDQHRAELDRLSNLDLTLMADDYLESLEHYVAAKDWERAETLTPDLELLDDVMKERGLHDARVELGRKV